MKLSCHPEAFRCFTRDLQIPGCETHVYYGPNRFGSVWDLSMLAPPGHMSDGEMPGAWEGQNIYFLAGVMPGLTKRAADSDVLKRGMFTLDFDIRKELEKKLESRPITDGMVAAAADDIICALMKHPKLSQMRYVVMSGNGMHVHYFGLAVPVRKEEWAAGMREIFDEVNTLTFIPCDTGCGNAGRIMRMPGSWNMKSVPPKPVEVLMWDATATFNSMQLIQDIGAERLERERAVKEKERKEFVDAHPEGGSNVIDLINRVPVEQVVAQLLGCRVGKTKTDGGMRFTDEHGVERGFFKHHEHNIIIHEGTSLFDPPAGRGYNPLGLVKAVKKCSAREAVLWFAARSQAIRDAQAREKEEWAADQGGHDVEIAESWFSAPTLNP